MVMFMTSLLGDVEIFLLESPLTVVVIGGDFLRPAAVLLMFRFDNGEMLEGEDFVRSGELFGMLTLILALPG